jgi:uncharacterized membrane protein YfcA
MEPVTVISILLGVVVGTLMGWTGAGGAVIGVPLLMLGLSLSLTQAAPVALVAVSLSAWLGAIAGLRAGTVRYKAAALVATAGMLATPLGLWTAPRVPDGILSLVFAAVLGCIAFIMWRDTFERLPAEQQRPARVPCAADRATGRIAWNCRCVQVLGFSGIGTGFISGLLGVGGGFLVVPTLAKATDLSIQSVVATCLAVVALISTTAFLAAAAGGRVDWAIALPFAAGAALGMIAGRRLAVRIPGRATRRLFAFIAFTVALGMGLGLSRGKSRSMFLRLCVRAPRIWMLFMDSCLAWRSGNREL